ncbi:MAG: methyltransferase family protein [Candidatus Thorarchaeota archaeon]
MSREPKRGYDVKDHVAASIAGIFFLIQFIVFMYHYNFNGESFLRWIGWLLLIPGFLLLILSVSTLKKHGALEEGKSWVHTTLNVQQGVYGIVRHPFSIGWILIVIALALVSQYWVSILCMGVQMPLILLDIYSEEELNEKRFGSDYSAYQESVPMFNIFIGIVRYYSLTKDAKSVVN